MGSRPTQPASLEQSFSCQNQIPQQQTLRLDLGFYQIRKMYRYWYQKMGRKSSLLRFRSLVQPSRYANQQRLVQTHERCLETQMGLQNCLQERQNLQMGLEEPTCLQNRLQERQNLQMGLEEPTCLQNCLQDRQNIQMENQDRQSLQNSLQERP